MKMLAPEDRSILLLFISWCLVGLNVTIASDCNAMKGSNVELIIWYDQIAEVAWSRVIPNASYKVEACGGTNLPPDMHHLVHYPICPKMALLTNCRNYPFKVNGTICTISHNRITLGEDVEAKFEITMPGCPVEVKYLKLNVTTKDSRARPVSNLQVVENQGSLKLTWKHKSLKHNHDHIRYFYVVKEIINSTNSILVEKEEIPYEESQTHVVLPLDHAFKLYEFCVNAQIGVGKKTVVRSKLSPDRCIRKRLASKEPSKPLKILCGVPEEMKACKEEKNETHRNVTLLWQLPDKKFWHGLPTVIKVVVNVESKEENATEVFNVSARRTKWTLMNLKRDAKYYIQLTFCSDGGDGPASKSLVIFEDEPTVSPTSVKEDDNMDRTRLAVITTATVIGFLILVVIFSCCFIKSKKLSKPATLPVLQPPEKSTGRSGTADNLLMNHVDYDFLMVNDPPIGAYLTKSQSSGRLSSDENKSTDSSIVTSSSSTFDESRQSMGSDDVGETAGDAKGPLMRPGTTTV